MSGGLIQLVSASNQDIVLTGNPSKTFFKSTYHKYTNFSLQKFRLDFEGAKTLRLSEESNFTFKVKRYADLLMDCYLSVDLPNIWSPIFPPNTDAASTENNTGAWIPYEFKWIENIGAQMISRITITCGNQTLQEYSGSYILAMAQRDFSGEKKALFDKMTGNVPELNNPANSGSRVNSYPNAYYTTNPAGAEPSIRGRTLYIPLNSWFTMKSQMAFPLVALQYNELQINVTMRPIQELFQIRDVMDSENNYPYVAPNFNLYYMQFYRFLQTPPDISLGVTSYTDTRTLWNADVHLNCTYCFLSNAESRIFALNEQKYLFRQVREDIFYNVTGSNRVQLNSIGMISNYTFYMQRSDANLRNEWSNYTNWPYSNLPSNNILAPNSQLVDANGDYPVFDENGDVFEYGMGVHVNNLLNSGITITGDLHPENLKEIMTTMGILLNGEYRENTLTNEIFNYVEKYTRTQGFAKEGLYCYNFCLNSSPFEYQPSGAINLSKFKDIQLEISTITPAIDMVNSQFNVICDLDGNPLGIQKSNWRLFDYNYNLTVFEERYNVLSFIGGNCGMLYSR
jgi:hypothetical protein